MSDDLMVGLTVLGILAGGALAAVVGGRYMTATALVAQPRPASPGYILQCGPAGSGTITVTKIDGSTVMITC